MKNNYVFVAINPDNDECFAWCSAERENWQGTVEELADWKRQGADVFLVSSILAKKLLLRQVLIA